MAIDTRGKLLRARVPLTDHPLLALAADDQLRVDVEEALGAYELALRAVQLASASLADHDSVEPSRRLMARMLCLDLAFIRIGDEWQAVAAPTHPFHLWRVSAMLEVFRERLDELKEIGAEALKAVVADPHTTAPHVVLSPYAVDLEEVSHARTLTSVGTFGALPLFSDPEGRQGGFYRVAGLDEVAKRLVRLMPHAAQGFRIALVDPPSVSGALEQLTALHSPLEDDWQVPLVVEILRTRHAPEATDEEHQKLAYFSRELIDAGGELDVVADRVSLADVAKRLEHMPVHLAVVFEPGDAKVRPLGHLKPPPLSPLTIPRSYKYDKFDDRIDVVISGEVPLFECYHAMFARTLDRPSAELLGRRSGASESRDGLERIARHTMWLTVVDQGIEPTFQLKGAERLDWRQGAGRDVVTVTAHTESVEDLIRDTTRVAGLPPSGDRVKSTLRELFELSGEAVLALLRAHPKRSLADPRIAKGVMGTLAAVRWYQEFHPNALIVSLDDPQSRRWILGLGEDNQRGDLLAVRSSDSGPILDAVEVKTREGAPPFTVSNARVEGKAVAQVDQTLAILRRVFDPGESPITAARKDVLRDQLYRAVAARPYDADRRGHLVNLLEELFERGPAEVQGILFSVRISTTDSPIWPSAPEYKKSPSENSIGLVEIVEGGRQCQASSSGHGGPPNGGDGGQARRQQAVSIRPSPDAGTMDPSDQSPDPARDSSAAGEIQVLIGSTPSGENVYWDPHNKEHPLNNFGLLVTGDSGAGKTQILRAFIHKIARAGVPICVFDYKNDYADPAFAEPVGLHVHDVNTVGLPFNPLELVYDEEGRVQPVRQIHELASILGRVFGLGMQMEARLRKAMQAAFLDHGVNPQQWVSSSEVPTAPSFDDVVEILRADDKNDNLLNRLDPLFDLGLFPSSDEASRSFEEMLASRVVLLFSGLPTDGIKQALSEFIIVRLHGHALRGEQPRRLRRLLVFDEAWRVGDSQRLQQLAREGRAFGIGIAIGTQFPGDIPDSLTGNLATQILLLNQTAEHQRSVVRTLLGSSSGKEAERLTAQVQRLQKHEGFVRNQQCTPYKLVMTLPHYKRGLESE